MKLFLSLLLFFNFLFTSSLFAAKSIQAPHVQIGWLVPKTFGSESTTIGILFKIDPEWHVYWKNPGDSGAPPKFKIISENATVGPIQWPYPHRLLIAHLTNLGYEKEVAYLFEVKPKDSSVQLEVKLEWLVCKEECTPGFGTLTLEKPVGEKSVWDPYVQKVLKIFQDRIPKPGDESPWKISSVQIQGENLSVQVLPKSDESVELYPLNGEFVSPAKPEVIQTKEGSKFIFNTVSENKPEMLGFVLVSGEKGWEFSDLPYSYVPIETAPTGSLSFWILLLSAFGGGILLNLMPCVFPVLSIKIFSLLKKHGGEPKSFKNRLLDGLSYSIGAIVTFTALGGLFIALRAAGTSIGWGFQLQSPIIVLSLILLFWLIAFNFLGILEFGYSVMNFAGKGGNWSSSFGTGVLSVFVAAPCTGPFMGSALGASATLPPIQAIGIFFALGAGLATPFLLLALTPALLSYLPKPGVWMERFKQFLAFPLFGTILWLLWVLGQQRGEEGWIIGGGLILMISFSSWLFQSKNRFLKIIALLLLIGSSIFSFQKINSLSSTTEMKKDFWIPYNSSQIESAQTQGKAVFVDFTAAWCITCQVNKKVVLETDQVTKLFKEKNVLTMKGDWTNYNPVITEALAKFGRSSVPLYVFYPADRSPPKILPQILTVSMIEELFGK